MWLLPVAPALADNSQLLQCEIPLTRLAPVMCFQRYTVVTTGRSCSGPVASEITTLSFQVKIHVNHMRSNTKESRNSPCSCQSGKKYKHCCMLHHGEDLLSDHDNGRIFNRASEVIFAAALSYHRAGEYEQAAQAYQKALTGNQAHADMYCRYGEVLDILGRNKEAIQAYTSALLLKPDSSAILNNLGLALQCEGNHERAATCFRQALKFSPSYIPALANLGRVLILMRDYHEAIEIYRRLLQLKPTMAQARHNLAFALEKEGLLEDALFEYEEARRIAPSMIAVQQGLGAIKSKLVPSWHIPMMNDTERNRAYHEALRNTITSKSHVFEIGTGAGLLSMMAAELGAASVTTCETMKPIAETALKIIEQNGFSGKINLMAKPSTEVDPNTDLREKPNVLISEILSSELLGEHVIPTMEDAKRRLVQPGCRVIPAAASIMVALFSSNEIAANVRVDSVHGFDLNGFNDLLPQRQIVGRQDLPFSLLSAPVEVFCFDFENENTWPVEEKELDVPILGSGQCLGVVQWIKVRLDRDVCYENAPSETTSATSWQKCVYLLPAPQDVETGDIAVLSAAHNRIFPWFSISKIRKAITPALPK